MALKSFPMTNSKVVPVDKQKEKLVGKAPEARALFGGEREPAGGDPARKIETHDDVHRMMAAGHNKGHNAIQARMPDMAKCDDRMDCADGGM
jgi:hypothetical protein